MPRKPAVETTPDGRLYFVDHRNDRWRVHDVAYGPPHAAPFKRRIVPLGDHRASSRYFVGEGGEQRSYKFDRDEPRGLTVDVLAAQLRKAAWPARGRFDGARHYTPGPPRNAES